jgi:hypothetical protein
MVMGFTGAGGTPGMWQGKASGAVTLSMNGTAVFTNVTACPTAGGCFTVALSDTAGSGSSVTLVGLGTGEPKVGSYPLQVASQTGQWTGNWEEGSSGSSQENVTSRTGTLKITASSSASLSGTFDYTGDLLKQGNDTGTTAHLNGTFDAVAGR